MKKFGAQSLLTLGLLVKAVAIVLAIFVAWPIITASTTEVAAQEEARDQEKKTEDMADKAADLRQDVAEAKPGPATQGLTPQAPVDPRINALLDSKRRELELEEDRIKREREDLERLREEVERRIKELKKVQSALEELVSAAQKQKRKRIQQLVKVLSNMRPGPAAKVVEKLDDHMAVEIFKLMQGRIAGKVMANLNPQQAARIGALLTKDKESKEAARLAREAAEAAIGPQKN